MINIFELRNGKITITEATLTVASLRDVWESDKSVKKGAAMDVFHYIYHMYDPRSPYSGYADEDREASIRKNELKTKLRIGKQVKLAIDDYRRLLDEADPIFRLFKGAKHAVYKLETYFSEVDPSKEGFKVSDLTRALKDIGDLIKSYTALEEQVVEKAAISSTKTRGSREINPYEQ